MFCTSHNFIWSFVIFPLNLFFMLLKSTLYSEHTLYGKCHAYILHFMWSNAQPLDFVFNQNVFLALKSYPFGVRMHTHISSAHIVTVETEVVRSTKTKKKKILQIFRCKTFFKSQKQPSECRRARRQRGCGVEWRHVRNENKKQTCMEFSNSSFACLSIRVASHSSTEWVKLELEQPKSQDDVDEHKHIVHLTVFFFHLWWQTFRHFRGKTKTMWTCAREVIGHAYFQLFINTRCGVGF